MNIINKLLGNPIIVALLITALVIFVTIIPTIYCKKDYKYQSYICSLMFLLISITILLVVYEMNRDCKPIVGGSEPTDFSHIFSSPVSFNQF